MFFISLMIEYLGLVPSIVNSTHMGLITQFSSLLLFQKKKRRNLRHGQSVSFSWNHQVMCSRYGTRKIWKKIFVICQKWSEGAFRSKIIFVWTLRFQVSSGHSYFSKILNQFLLILLADKYMQWFLLWCFYSQQAVQAYNVDWGLEWLVNLLTLVVPSDEWILTIIRCMEWISSEWDLI